MEVNMTNLHLDKLKYVLNVEYKVFNVDATVPGMVAYLIKFNHDSIMINPHPKFRIEEIDFEDKTIKLIYLED